MRAETPAIWVDGSMEPENLYFSKRIWKNTPNNPPDGWTDRLGQRTYILKRILGAIGWMDRLSQRTYSIFLETHPEKYNITYQMGGCIE